MDRIVEYKDRHSLTSGEKRVKNIVKDLALKLEIKNKKECFMATKDEYDNIIEHSNSIVNKYKDKEKVVDVDNNKTKNIIDMFERGKLTFEHMEKLFYINIK